MVKLDAVFSYRAKSRFVSLVLYFVAYLAGIFTCLLYTPVQMKLGAVLWYPLVSWIGFFLFYLLPPQYLVFGDGIVYCLICSMGFLPVVLALATYFGMIRLKPWRPLWVGLPIGFIGTLGVYYTAAASV